MPHLPRKECHFELSLLLDPFLLAARLLDSSQVGQKLTWWCAT
jgi:hypothetical protein